MKTRLLMKLRRMIRQWYYFGGVSKPDLLTVMRMEIYLRQMGLFDGFWDRNWRKKQKLLDAIRNIQTWLDLHGVRTSVWPGKALDALFWQVFTFGRLDWNVFVRKYAKYSRKYWLPDAVLRRAVEGIE